MKPTFKHTHYSEVPADEFGPEAPGVTIRRLIDNELDGAPFYNMRMIEIAPEGHTPDHHHANEHENFVIDGKGEVMVDGQWHPLGVGDVIFVPPGVRHQYKNAGDTVFRFICGVPVSRLLK
jgi:quercetin dioxygenase-like cupin family protein